MPPELRGRIFGRYNADEVTFVAPASKVYVSAETLAGLEVEQATRVDYVAARDRGKDPAKLGTWHVYEDTMILTGPRKKDPALTLRRVFVHSSARAAAAVTARDKKIDRARDDLARLVRGLGSRHYPNVAAVEARLTTIGRTRRVTAYLTTDTTRAEKRSSSIEFHRSLVTTSPASPPSTAPCRPRRDQRQPATGTASPLIPRAQVRCPSHQREGHLINHRSRLTSRQNPTSSAV
jgi:hypothetical protein